MKARSYSGDDLDAWDKWYERLDEAGPYHTPKYLDLLADEYERGTGTPELFVYGDKETFVYYPYLRRPLEELPFADKALKTPANYSDIISSWYWGGPIPSSKVDDEVLSEFVDAFGDYCRETAIVSEFLRFDPNLQNHEDFADLDPQFSRETVRVDLTASKEEIWENYEGRNQRAIKQARDSSLEVAHAYGPEEVGAFHHIYSNAMEARDASEHYRFSRNFFERILDSELFSLVTAYHGDEVVGGFIIAHDDRIAHHYLSASNPEYWDDRVNNLLYHRVVMHMKESGRQIFDFQGGRPGVFKFKKGFSTDGRGEFHIATKVHLPDVYDNLVSAATDHGIDTASDYFPAYREETTN